MREGARKERIRPILVARRRRKENNTEVVHSYKAVRIQQVKEGDGTADLLC